LEKNSIFPMGERCSVGCPTAHTMEAPHRRASACGRGTAISDQALLRHISGGDEMATTIDSRRETVSLIGSDKVEGTPVYGGDDRKIGTVQRVMIDKISGKVAYAVISFGGFLGMGEDHYPLPWTKLKYDPRLEGDRVGGTE